VSLGTSNKFCNLKHIGIAREARILLSPGATTMQIPPEKRGAMTKLLAERSKKKCAEDSLSDKDKDKETSALENAHCALPLVGRSGRAVIRAAIGRLGIRCRLT
jgi:hypothetical protein